MPHLQFSKAGPKNKYTIQQQVAQCRMAPNLARSTIEFIYDMIVGGELTTSQMAEAAGCSKRTVLRIRSNLRMSGSVKAPLINKGRPQSVKSDMMEALIDHLLEKPSLYLNEMQLFFLDEFGTHTKIHY